MYASEIWGTVRLDDIEKVHMMACKRLFFRSSSENTEQDGSWWTRSIHTFFVNSTLRCLKYWLRVLKMDDVRIPKQAYKMMILMDESEKKCCVTEVKNVLSKNGFYCVWLQGVGDENIFYVNWNRDLQTILFKNGMQLFEIKTYFSYRNVKSIFEPEQYQSPLNMLLQSWIVPTATWCATS